MLRRLNMPLMSCLCGILVVAPLRAEQQMTPEQYARTVNHTLGKGVPRQQNAAVAVMLTTPADAWDDPGLHEKLLRALSLRTDQVQPLELPREILHAILEQKLNSTIWAG